MFGSWWLNNLFKIKLYNKIILFTSQSGQIRWHSCFVKIARISAFFSREIYPGSFNQEKRKKIIETTKSPQ